MEKILSRKKGSQITVVKNIWGESTNIFSLQKSYQKVITFNSLSLFKNKVKQVLFFKISS